jgi:hypothetical protein
LFDFKLPKDLFIFAFESDYIKAVGAFITTLEVLGGEFNNQLVIDIENGYFV